MDPDKNPKTVIRDWLRGDVSGQTYGGLTDPNSSERAGANWIYDDKPLTDLSSSSYPRVSILQVTKQKVTRGGRSSLAYDRIHLQVDVYCAERITNLQVGGTSYDQQQLTDILAQQMQEGMITYLTDDLFTYGGLYLPTDEEWMVNDIQSRRDEGRDAVGSTATGGTRDYDVWVKTFEIVLRGFNTGV